MSVKFYRMFAIINFTTFCIFIDAVAVFKVNGPFKVNTIQIARVVAITIAQ
jgi:hypothetical protein